MTKKILIVDDESKIRDMVRTYLAKEGFTVVEVKNGNEALAQVRQGDLSLVILDWMMPDISGIEVLNQMRKHSQVPVIMLTAKTEEVDKLLGLEIGADDYITKPFSLRELTARIRALMRRAAVQLLPEQDVIKTGALTLALSEHQVWVGGQAVENLTPTEFKILGLLAQHHGRVFTRLQLLEHVLGEAYEGYERSLDTHISNLRKKLETGMPEAPHIKTIHGVGYKLETRSRTDESPRSTMPAETGTLASNSERGAKQSEDRN